MSFGPGDWNCTEDITSGRQDWGSLLEKKGGEKELSPKSRRARSTAGTLRMYNEFSTIFILLNPKKNKKIVQIFLKPIKYLHFRFLRYRRMAQKLSPHAGYKKSRGGTASRDDGSYLIFLTLPRAPCETGNTTRWGGAGRGGQVTAWRYTPWPSRKHC